MMQKLWDYIIKRCKDDIGVEKYLKHIFVNFGMFALWIGIVLIMISIATR